MRGKVIKQIGEQRMNRRSGDHLVVVKHEGEILGEQDKLLDELLEH